MNNKRKCNCEICNNSIREERQFMHFEVQDGVFVLLDVEEFAYIHNYIEIRKINEDETLIFDVVEPEDDNELVIAYGVLIPQADNETELGKWKDEVAKYKNYAFSTLEDGKEYRSAYKDIVLYEDHPVYYSHIPCAVLLDTLLELGKKNEYGFGHTMFLRNGAEKEVLNNVLNRDFVLCIRDVEKKTYNAKVQNDKEDWKKYIDLEKVLQNAKELF